MKNILFLGDGALNGPACYLAGALKHSGFRVTHFASGRAVSKSILKKKFGGIILSDFPFRELSAPFLKWIQESVFFQGMGLLMIGGWASFNGIYGNYRGSEIEEILPVSCLPHDDRRNLASGASIVPKRVAHPILRGLPFKPSPVMVGYNQVKAKKKGQIILELRENESGRRNPLLVVGHYGIGKTAAFTTDAAPHWCGGLVDWGNKRLRIKIHSDIRIEVGNLYVQFLSQLVNWLCGGNHR